MAFLNGMMERWQETFTVRRVFGEPIERDGLTVIPVAMVAGGGGGGTGPVSAESTAENSGGGFGGMGRPVGAYVVRADSVEWHPALDVTLLGMAGIALTTVIAVIIGRALGSRR